MEHPTPPPQQQHQLAQETAERDPGSDTRIYVASLSDYNDGRLHGAWIDADGDPDDLAAEVQAMLARSPMRREAGGAEEWAIHDYEGFGPVRLGEYEDLATISMIGQGIAEHGPAFAHLSLIHI